MQEVLIIFNAEAQPGRKIIPTSPVTQKMVSALQTAIAQHSPATQVEAISTAALWSGQFKPPTERANLIYCPLTIQLPDWLLFPGQKIFQACQDIDGLRQWVEQSLGYQTSLDSAWLGDLWLPVVWTAKKPLYGEAIGEGAIPNFYEQPVELTLEVRQRLYDLARQLLAHLQAPPSVYLIQFRLLGKEIVFDRLWPFPAAPALASLKHPQSDLFTCYWYCLSHKPLKKLISSPSEQQ